MGRAAWLQKTITDLRGAWTRLDQVEAKPNRAVVAQNIRFSPGKVRSRDGFQPIFTPTGRVPFIYSWNAALSNWNQIIYFKRTTVQGECILRDLRTSTQETLFFNNAAITLQVAEAGNKAFVATVVAISAGAVVGDAVHVVSPSPITTDLAFAKPMTTACVVAAPGGTASTTPGAHSFAYIMESRTGFIGQPSPQPADVFTPTTFTVVAGLEQLTVALTATWPEDAAVIHFIMNRVDNPNRWYFIPGASSFVIPGVLSTAGATVDISDERLADSAEEANDYFNTLAQNQAGTAPVLASNVAAYGKRLVYIVLNKAYVSDPSDFQNISEDRHVVQLPGAHFIISAFALRSLLYLVGSSWTASVSDNGDIPATWAAPAEVSSTIGSPAIYGVEWRTAGDYAWVASVTGLYLFDGQYGPRPISYYNSDIWDQINWASAAATLTVRDDLLKKRVYVAAPLGIATSPSHLLVWDYSRGLTPDAVDFSVDVFGTAVTAERFAALSLVQRELTLDWEVWLGPTEFTGGNVLREVIGDHTDNGNAIATIYKTGMLLLPTEQQKRLSRFGSIEALIRGSGVCGFQAGGLDRVTGTNAISLTLATAVYEAQEIQFYLTEQNLSVAFGTEAAGAWFELASLKLSWKPYSY